MSTILRPFGRTGLMVSPVTLGTMEFGSKLDEAEAGKLFAQALDSGINMVDTANVYAGGRSEEILGWLIGSMRDRLIIKTEAGAASLEFAKAPTLVRTTTSLSAVELRVPGSTAYAVDVHTGAGTSSVKVDQDPSSTHRIEVRTEVGAVKIEPLPNKSSSALPAHESTATTARSTNATRNAGQPRVGRQLLRRGDQRSPRGSRARVALGDGCRSQQDRAD